MITRFFNNLSKYFNTVGNNDYYSLHGFNSSYSYLAKEKLANAALKNPYFGIVIRDLAKRAANMPIILLDEDDREVDIFTTNLAILDTPNQDIKSTSELIECVFQNQMAFGDSLIYTNVDYSVGFNLSNETLTTDNKLYCPKFCNWNIEEDVRDSNLARYYCVTTYPETEKFLPVEVLHIKEQNILGKTPYGLSPIWTAEIALANSSELFNSEYWLYKNKGLTGILSVI